MTWWETRCQRRHYSRWIMKRFKWMRHGPPSLPPPPSLLPSKAILITVLLPAFWESLLCVEGQVDVLTATGCCSCFVTWFLSSEECQFPFSSAHLIHQRWPWANLRPKLEPISNRCTHETKMAPAHTANTHHQSPSPPSPVSCVPWFHSLEAARKEPGAAVTMGIQMTEAWRKWLPQW